MKILFTVLGNQEDSQGNPLGYVRSTQRGIYRHDFQRYLAWKDHVILHYESAGGQHQTELDKRKPLTTSKGKKVYMNLVIWFKDFTHCDPDNVFKGLADTLFANDKYLAGSFDFGYDKANPRVEVEIESEFNYE